jgi:hypothetical protein
MFRIAKGSAEIWISLRDVEISIAVHDRLAIVKAVDIAIHLRTVQKD